MAAAVAALVAFCLGEPQTVAARALLKFRMCAKLISKTLELGTRDTGELK